MKDPFCRKPFYRKAAKGAKCFDLMNFSSADHHKRRGLFGGQHADVWIILSHMDFYLQEEEKDSPCPNELRIANM
jgi:hypothetical protein